MTQVKFYAREDSADGHRGEINLANIDAKPSVELVFDGDQLPSDASRRRAIPSEQQTVLVNGVKRYFWMELAGCLRPRWDLRNIQGHDLRRREVRVITTDDARRYAFIAEPDLPREVFDAIPTGVRRAKP